MRENRTRRAYTSRVMELFIEDLKDLESAGYVLKKDYADRLGLTKAAFDRRVCRARAAGLLPPGKYGVTGFHPYG